MFPRNTTSITNWICVTFRVELGKNIKHILYTAFGWLSHFVRTFWKRIKCTPWHVVWTGRKKKNRTRKTIVITYKPFGCRRRTGLGKRPAGTVCPRTRRKHPTSRPSRRRRRGFGDACPISASSTATRTPPSRPSSRRRPAPVPWPPTVARPGRTPRGRRCRDRNTNTDGRPPATRPGPPANGRSSCTPGSTPPGRPCPAPLRSSRCRSCVCRGYDRRLCG